MNSAPPQPHSIGIDIGGTHVRVGVVSADQCVVANRRIRSRRLRAQSDFVELLAILIERVRHDAGIADKSCIPIGLAVPGIIDRESGVVLRSVNLPFLEQSPSEVSVASQLSRRVCQPVTLMTDAEAATWGEYVAWRSDGHRNDPCGFLHLRLGTGVACGLIVNGKLVALPRTGSGHLDDLVVNSSADAPICKCGKRGCLELYASGPAFERHAETLTDVVGLSDWDLAAMDGNADAVAAMEQVAFRVSKAVTNLQAYSGRLAAVLGGGVFTDMPFLYVVIDRCLLGNANCEFGLNRLGDNAGIIGAAILARKNHFASLASARAIDE